MSGNPVAFGVVATRGGFVVTPLCPICASPVTADARSCPTCGAPLTPPVGGNTGKPSHAAALKPGTRLDSGGFSVGRVLGHGGFGITYLGADLRRGHPVALKEFFPAGSSRQELDVIPPVTLQGSAYQSALGRFLEEGRILARFRHPGIVDVYGVFQENATAYMAMEYLRGQTLAERMAAYGGPLPEAELLALARALTAALETIHDAGFLHRDIKPENVILAEGEDTPRPVLIDFGATREFASNKTLRQSVVLTPGYAPLEQYAQQARRGPFTDIYALAATLYHLATGEQPPAATDRAMGVALKPPRALNPALGVAFERALLHGLEMAVDRRPQHARAFYHELAGLPPPPVPAPAPPAGASEPATPPTPPVMSPPPPPPQSWPGHLGRVRTIARALDGDGTAPSDGGLRCPVCRSATMIDPATGGGPLPCPICRAAELREQVPAAARGHCPGCRTGVPEPVQASQLVPGMLLRCPACRVGAVVQYARPGGLLLPDIWARCDTCGADFDYHLQGDRLTLAELPNGPGQLDPALRGTTLPRGEWQRRADRTALLYLCPTCATEIDIHPDDGSGRTLEWVATEGRLDRVPAPYRGRRCTPLELDKAAAGLAAADGTHACPHCRAQFDEVARDRLALLAAPDDPFGAAARFGDQPHDTALWRAIAAGKRNPATDGLICPVCTAEMAPEPDGSYHLTAYDPTRDPYAVGACHADTREKRGTRLAITDWQRIAAGQPPTAEAQRLREEADREFWLALCAGEVSLVERAAYPDPLGANESVVVALDVTRYRRNWVSYRDVDTGTLWITTQQLRYRGERGDVAIPLTAIRGWATERWDGGTAKEQDVATIRGVDADKQVAFGIRPAAQHISTTVDALPLQVRLDADRFVALCKALQEQQP